MDKLDRLGWAAGLAFVSHGARIGIRVNDPAMLERLPAFLPPGSVPSPFPVVHDLYSLILGSNGQRPNVRHYNLLYVGSAQLARTMDLGEVFGALQEHLQILLAVRAPRRLFVRAGVIGWRGKAVIIPGDDSTGVTSLVAALVRAGGTYCSNTYAVLNARGCVHAYPTPLGDEGNKGESAKKTAIEAAGHRTREKPLPVGLIVFREPEPQTFSRPRELSPAQAVLGLLSHTPASRLRPTFALKILGRSVAGAVALEIAGEEPNDIVAQLLDRLDGVPPLMRTC